MFGFLGRIHNQSESEVDDIDRVLSQVMRQRQDDGIDPSLASERRLEARRMREARALGFSAFLPNPTAHSADHGPYGTSGAGHGSALARGGDGGPNERYNGRNPVISGGTATHSGYSYAYGGMMSSDEDEPAEPIVTFNWIPHFVEAGPEFFSKPNAIAKEIQRYEESKGAGLRNLSPAERRQRLLERRRRRLARSETKHIASGILQNSVENAGREDADAAGTGTGAGTGAEESKSTHPQRVSGLRERARLRAERGPEDGSEEGDEKEENDNYADEAGVGTEEKTVQRQPSSSSSSSSSSAPSSVATAMDASLDASFFFEPISRAVRSFLRRSHGTVFMAELEGLFIRFKFAPSLGFLTARASESPPTMFTLLASAADDTQGPASSSVSSSSSSSSVPAPATAPTIERLTAPGATDGGLDLVSRDHPALQALDSKAAAALLANGALLLRFNDSYARLVAAGLGQFHELVVRSVESPALGTLTVVTRASPEAMAGCAPHPYTLRQFLAAESDAVLAAGASGGKGSGAKASKAKRRPAAVAEASAVASPEPGC